MNRRAFALQHDREARTATLLIYGDIGESWDSPASVSAQRIAEQLREMTGVTELDVRINSCGGSVADGLAIYNALRTHSARVVVTVDGVAVSAASLIAMAGDEVRMPPASLMMIHAPWAGAIGNATALRDLAEMLDRYADAMAEAYAAKTGRPLAAMRALLDDEDHWFTAREAVAAGFADALIEETEDSSDAAAHFAGIGRYLDRAPPRIAAALRPNRENVMPESNVNSPLAAEDELRQRLNKLHTALTSSFGSNPGVHALCCDLAAGKLNSDAFGEKVLAVIGAGNEPLSGGTGRVESYPVSYQSGVAASVNGSFCAAAADALLLREGLALANPHPGSRDLRGWSLSEMARTCLAHAGKSHSHLTGTALVRAAMTTSDFPLLLANTASKALRQGFEAEPQSHRAWVRKSTAPNFKKQTRPILGSAPELLEVGEGAAYTFGAMDEDAAEFQVTKWGRTIRLTWELLVNDDLGAFLRAQSAMGQAAMRREADQIYALFQENGGAGQTMQDSVALFHASHGNLASSATALDAAALSSARTLLRKQTAVGGGLLNLRPRFLIVPAELESEAEALIAASTKHVMSANNAEAMTSSWIASLALVVEPRLPDSAFYVASGAPQIDTVELAYLEEDDGPIVIEEELTGVDARDFRVRHVFAARFLDWRGIAKVPLSGS